MSNSEPSTGWTVNADSYLSEQSGGGRRLSVRLLWAGLALVVAGLVVPYVVTMLLAAVTDGSSDYANLWVIVGAVMAVLLPTGITLLASALAVRGVEHFLPTTGAARPMPALLTFRPIFWIGVALAIVGLVIQSTHNLWSGTLAGGAAPIEIIASEVVGFLERVALLAGIAMVGASFVLLSLTRRAA